MEPRVVQLAVLAAAYHDCQLELVDANRAWVAIHRPAPSVRIGGASAGLHAVEIFFGNGDMVQE